MYYASALDIYLMSFPPSISEAMYKIIKELWGKDSDDFPKPWVSNKILDDITGQKNADRRVRNLRDELGCYIESGYYNSEYCYRLTSDFKKPNNIRKQIGDKTKKELFKKYFYQCAICGDPGAKKLHADHRVPAIRKGTNDKENLQVLCSHCNIIKRSSCAGCTDNCQNCALAYPEKYIGIDLNWDYSI
jgi:hypothetical protein